MKHLFVPYKIAKQLKEKGFDEPCLAEYINGGIFTTHQQFNFEEELSPDKDMEFSTYKNSYTNFFETYNPVSAPLYQQVLDWLETKGIYIELLIDGWGEDNKVSSEYICYRAFIWKIGDPKPRANDDIGAHSRYVILDVTIEHALSMI